jgi:GNAT superfamily N-acetyltransferase
MTNFSGLTPFTFIKNVEELLGGLGVTGIDRVIEYTYPPPELMITLMSKDFDDNITGLLFRRRFSRFGTILTVKHDFMVLPKKHRGKGIGKKVLAVCLEQYLKMGVEKIHVQAGLEDGGYVWARAGFRAKKRAEVDLILAAAKAAKFESDDLAIVQSWYDDHYNNFPDLPFKIEDWARIKAMEPILRQSNWHGEIDLTKQDELINFTRYVSRPSTV